MRLLKAAFSLLFILSPLTVPSLSSQSQSTLAFYRRVLILEVWGFASRVMRSEAMKGEWYPREKRKEARKRERTTPRSDRRTVRALNPFKYNQYREVPSTLVGHMDMIFTVHSRITRKPRTDTYSTWRSRTLGRSLTARNIRSPPS